MTARSLSFILKHIIICFDWISKWITEMNLQTMPNSDQTQNANSIECSLIKQFHWGLLSIRVFEVYFLLRNSFVEIEKLSFSERSTQIFFFIRKPLLRFVIRSKVSSKAIEQEWVVSNYYVMQKRIFFKHSILYLIPQV